MNKCDVLLKFAQVEIDYAKHHETQRERMTSLILVITGFGVASVGWDKQANSSDLPVGVLLIVLGIFGIIFSLKHYAHYKLHYARYRSYRRAIDEEFEPPFLLQLKDRGDEYSKREMRYPFTERIPLHQLWAFLPALSAFVGISIIVLAFK